MQFPTRPRRLPAPRRTCPPPTMPSDPTLSNASEPEGTWSPGRAMSAELIESRHHSTAPILIGSVLSKDGRMTLRFRLTLPQRSAPGPRTNSLRSSSGTITSPVSHAVSGGPHIISDLYDLCP